MSSQPKQQHQMEFLEHELFLKSRFSPEFFRSIPTTPGVYFLKNKEGEILYVGKAKNLRRRISSYKHIHPKKNSRKLYRLTFQTHQIHWETCESETEALLRENHYLRSLKPSYNKSNTRPEYYHYLNLRVSGLKFRFRFERDLDPKAQYVFGSFRSKNFNREKLKHVLQVFHFLDSDTRANYQLPHHLVIKSDQFLLHARYHQYFEGLIKFLKGESRVFLETAEAHLLQSPPHCGFTLYQLQQALDDARNFFDSTLSRLYRMAQALPQPLPYVPKDDLDDSMVRLTASYKPQAQELDQHPQEGGR